MLSAKILSSSMIKWFTDALLVVVFQLNMKITMMLCLLPIIPFTIQCFMRLFGAEFVLGGSGLAVDQKSREFLGSAFPEILHRENTPPFYLFVFRLINGMH